MPSAGMVGCSLRHGGEELLGQRNGLGAYVREFSTMGIPLLYPWANRLAGSCFEVAGRKVDLDAAPDRLKRDANGLPIHGLLSAASGWEVVRHQPADGGGLLAAAFDFGADQELLAAFPFPHRLRFEARVRGSTLSIELTVEASAGSPVPVSFGFHPYLCLPGAERKSWVLQAPVRERLILGPGGIPTGEREPAGIETGPLGEREFDDAFLAPAEDAAFALSGGGRRVELAFDRGYPCAQIYAPPGDELIAIEPMTAPTNALVEGGPELPVLAPGEEYRASFSVSVGWVPSEG